MKECSIKNLIVGNNENTNSTSDENESMELLKKKKKKKKTWGTNKVHNKDNKDTEWLSNIKSELSNLDHEEDVIISKKDFQEMLQKHSHWKAPGKDGLQGYWINGFKSLHDKLLILLNLCL